MIRVYHDAGNLIDAIPATQPEFDGLQPPPLGDKFSEIHLTDR